jgi:proton-dependent oligopeptide transporter, POT family
MSQPNSEMFGHPKGLTLLFFTEMWERFSYYGMRAIFSLYMIQALLLNKKEASTIYGSYTGLVYLTPLIGGYVADRYWGNRKSILFGGATMALGQFLMFMSASNFENKAMAIPLMWSGLVCLMVGNGFFKPNISSMVGQLYSEGDRRKDSAFTIFYMGINLGAAIAPIVCGALGDTGNPADFKYGFLAACIGMIFGTILFWVDKNKYVVTPEGKAIGAVPNTAVLASDATNAGLGVKQLGIGVGLFLAAFLVFFKVLDFDWIGALIYSACISMPLMIITDPSLSKIERDRIIVIYVAAFFVIFFWAAFEQAGASLTFFADEQTDRTVGMTIPTYMVHLVSLGLLGLLYWAFRGMQRIFKRFDGLSTLLYTFLGGSAAFLVWKNIGIMRSGEGIKLDEIPASFFQSVNAIAVVTLAPIIAMIWVWLQKRKMEPNSLAKQALGLIILAIGYVVIAVGVKGVGLGDKISMWWLIGLYVIHTIGELCLSPIGLSLVSKLSPMRLVSLLFGVWFLANAVANKAAGQLSGLYPPSGAEYTAAAKLGIDNNTYRGILEKTISPTAEQVTLLAKESIPTTFPSFLGNPVNDLVEFFWIFVLLAGVAGGILFLLSFPLRKMMHGAD